MVLIDTRIGDADLHSGAGIALTAHGFPRPRRADQVHRAVQLTFEWRQILYPADARQVSQRFGFLGGGSNEDRVDEGVGGAMHANAPRLEYSAQRRLSAEYYCGRRRAKRFPVDHLAGQRWIGENDRVLAPVLSPHQRELSRQQE